MTIYNTKDILKLKDKIFVFDTNILLDLYCYYNPLIKKESEFISNFLIKNKIKIYVDNLIINEFINIYIKKSLEDKFNKKINRNTSDYNNCLETLKSKLEHIRRSYNIIKHKDVNIFCKLQEIEDYKNIFNKMEFTDYTIKETAKINNAILITNDNDFYNCDIDILKI